MRKGAKRPAKPDIPVGTLWRVILASAAGTLIEWYDFYIFGSLAVILAPQFFPKDNPTAGLLFTLATFATGFVVRPFGAVIFGRMGDIVGRKHTFLLTLMIMGLSTFAIGLIPNYEQIGALAPIGVLLLRLCQGLAIGGEYGGAATYVAEHSPAGRRGFFTSFLQTTATFGLFLSLLVILATRSLVGEADFAERGWRIPFLLSIVLVALSYAVRRKMDESPLFARVKEQGEASSNPIRESFVDPANRRLVLIALFGAITGQAVIWYTAQFYSLFFIQTVLNIQSAAATKIVAIALIVATPFYIFFGALSDQIGRKKLIVTGCFLGTVGLIPIFSGMVRVGTFVPNGAPLVAIDTNYVVKTRTETVVRTETYVDGAGAKMTKKIPSDPKQKPTTEVIPSPAMFWPLAGLVLIQVLISTVAYSAIAAFLVELFPTRIRYTSLSLPYHLGNGIFGGLVPLIGTAMVSATGNKLAGVFFPTLIAFTCFVVGATFIREKRTAEGYAELT